MKKTLSILMAALMIIALAIPAFAEDVTNNNVTNDESNGSVSQEVKASYEKLENDVVATVYLVNITWNIESDLTYSDGTQKYKWNAEDTIYETSGDPEGKGWDGEATVEITVTNKSNAEVKATASWKAEGEIDAKCEFDGNYEVTVESAAKETNITAGSLDGKPVNEKITGTVTVEKDSTGIASDDAVVGTVTVIIAPKG